MKFTVSGSPGSNHILVAEMLANRLSLDLITAEDLVSKYTKEKGIDYTEFSKHVNAQYDSDINSIITASLTQNYVLDSLCGFDLVEDSIKVFLYTELTSENALPRTRYIDKKIERKFVQDATGSDMFDSTNYDYYINCTGLTEDYIVQFIIDKLTKGEKGCYISANLVVPDRIDVEVNLSANYREDNYFNITKFYSTYILHDNYEQAILATYNNDLLRVSGDEIKKIDEAVVLGLPMYSKWFELLAMDSSIAELNIMLTKYCSSFDSYDTDLMFVNLSQNGNPVKRLIELGYSK